MRKCKNVKVGDVVRFPYYEFAPMRSGWNGWLFTTGIVKRIYTSTKGFKCAELVYQARTKEYKELTFKIRCDYLFEGDVEWIKKSYLEHGIKCEGFDLLKANNIIQLKLPCRQDG